MDMLNVASTGMYTILALIVNFKGNACKNWTPSLKLVVILSAVSLHWNCAINIQYISLTPDKELNSLIYRTLFYVNIYWSYKLSKNSPVFIGPPCILVLNPRWINAVLGSVERGKNSGSRKRSLNMIELGWKLKRNVGYVFGHYGPAPL